MKRENDEFRSKQDLPELVLVFLLRNFSTLFFLLLIACWLCVVDDDNDSRATKIKASAIHLLISIKSTTIMNRARLVALATLISNPWPNWEVRIAEPLLKWFDKSRGCVSQPRKAEKLRSKRLFLLRNII